jgi:hypothetical protein
MATQDCRRIEAIVQRATKNNMQILWQAILQQEQGQVS